MSDKFRPDDTTARRAVAWLERPAPRSWALVVFLVALGALILYGFQLGESIDRNQRTQQDVNELSVLARQQQRANLAIDRLVMRVRGDEQASCLVQHAGLPAQHELVSVMIDINRVLTAPLSRAQRQAQRRYRPTRRARHAFRTLEHDLIAYAVLSQRVPASRSC